MKISIITPSFNQAQYLEQTIDSVLSQNYPNLEYILIDGGSTDGSLDIIKKHEKYLAYSVSEKDSGQSHAINKGIAKATGEVINWLNSDDYYEPDALKVIGDFFSDPTSQVLCAKSNIIENGKIMRQSNGTDLYENNLAKTIGWARTDQPETFFRQSAFQQIGPLNENLHYVMDREWWMRYLFHFGLDGIKRINNIVVNFRLHSQSKTETKKVEFEWESNQLYRSLANQASLAETVGLIETILASNQLTKIIEFPSPNMELAREAIQYFLLHRADQEYYRLNFQSAQQLLNQIDAGCFKRVDQKLLNKLSFRMKYLPAPVVKFLRKWR